MLLPAIFGRTVMLKNIRPEEVTIEYVSWLNNPTINKYLEARHTEVSLDTQKEFIDHINNSADTSIFGIFLEANHMVGTTKLGPIDSNFRTADIGILIGDSRYWQKGLATEVIQILCEAIQSTQLLRKITAGAAESNIGSIKAFEKMDLLLKKFDLDPELMKMGIQKNVLLSKIL